ncbi:hypothetical protein DP113_23745 [Brasilonema octagenarum UFV-E1]|uniref:Uncharacterized protein n=1 Tax=Brasilonema sennae CENA114 TaxID=415709 RepID=A0A856MH23_9CYAN|nr:hypothetical protein DP114_23840 [Brasilonema sennae CENA114]QDL16869.1 hypothetical protein DP113_23745 [Brasilonema octagenarum UFV-E1]
MKTDPSVLNLAKQKALERLAVFRLQALFVFNLLLTPYKQYHRLNEITILKGDTSATALLS